MKLQRAPQGAATMVHGVPPLSVVFDYRLLHH